MSHNCVTVGHASVAGTGNGMKTHTQRGWMTPPLPSGMQRNTVKSSMPTVMALYSSLASVRNLPKLLL